MKKKQEQILSKCEKEIGKMDATKHPRTKRYSEQLKNNVASYLNSGGKKAIISNRLGIPMITINRWVQKDPKVALFKEVKVASNNIASNQKFTLKTPSGYQVQFEHLQDLASVLKLIA